MTAQRSAERITQLQYFLLRFVAWPLRLNKANFIELRHREVRRIPLLRGSVNKGKKRKDRGPVWQEEGFVLDKDTGPPFGQDESLLL
jgi:hypothetical protein